MGALVDVALCWYPYPGSYFCELELILWVACGICVCAVLLRVSEAGWFASGINEVTRLDRLIID